MRHRLLARRWQAVLAAACIAPGAQAVDWRPDAVMLQAGATPDRALQAGAGLVWDWDWRSERRALLTAQTELIVSHWRYDAFGGGSGTVQQITLLPLLRMQLDRGTSPWYLELGIGASWLGKDYVGPDKTFSTRWNFYDVVGFGYRFGARRAHELGLRYVHISNLGIRKPNPGEDFLLLRYAMRF